MIVVAAAAAAKEIVMGAAHAMPHAPVLHVKRHSAVTVCPCHKWRHCRSTLDAAHRVTMISS